MSVLLAEEISAPGAKTSTNGPKLENEARASVISVAPTVMASATRFGVMLLASTLSLPADTTTVIPLSIAALTASSIA